LPVEPKNIESVERHVLPFPVHQVFEDAAAEFIEADDLAVDYRVLDPEPSKCRGKRAEGFVHNVLSGDQLASTILDVSDRPEAVMRQKTLERCKTEYAEADRLFAPFQEKKKKVPRTYYYDRFQINLAVDEELGQAIREELKRGTSLAQLTRQALTKYFGL
jgi:hypothetical protein